MTNTADSKNSIQDLIRTKFLKLPQITPFESAVMHLGQRQENLAMVVDEQERLVGIFRNEELTHAIITKKSKTSQLKDIMSANPVVVKSNCSIFECATTMSKNSLSIVPVVDSDIIIGFVNLVDLQLKIIKELKRLKDSNAELTNQLNYKDDYLGVVSHDVRTPLSVISLSCDYLLSESSRKILTNDQASFVERIRRNAENAANMVTDILDVVRLEKGFSLDYVETNVDDFLGDCISNLQVIANEKNLEVVVSCKEHLTVSMDQKRMIHVLENLVNNAVKFSPSGKKIYVSASSEERDGQTYLLLSVRDEGQGIKEEDQERIFDKFQQLESGVAKTLGIGLGLSIAKKFVSLHRGFMEVEGGWQKGATFKAYIPGARIGGDQKKSKNFGKPRVLIVEDDVSIREYFEEELDQAGFDVFSACDGDDGIHAYFRFKPDLIMSDIRMPNVDGLELLAKVRMTDKDIPFILCSGYYPGLAEDLASSEYKANHVLEKPVTTDYIIKIIGQFLNSTRNAS